MLVCKWHLKIHTVFGSNYQFPLKTVSHNAKTQLHWVTLGYGTKSPAHTWALPAPLAADPGIAPGSLNNPHQSKPIHWGPIFSSEKRHG